MVQPLTVFPILCSLIYASKTTISTPNLRERKKKIHFRNYGGGREVPSKQDLPWQSLFPILVTIIHLDEYH